MEEFNIRNVMFCKNNVIVKEFDVGSFGIR
jgi:hypothetical protein